MHALTQTDQMALTQLAQSRALPTVSHWSLRVAYLVFIWSQRSRTRAQLSRLDFLQLEDIGMTAKQAKTECRKWFWRP